MNTIQELYRNSRLPINYQLEWDDAASRIRYAHLQALLPLQKKLAQLSSRFPESLEAYRAMYNNQDMQLKVARFLMGGNMRDSMLSDFGWAWRQVKPLTDVFDRDVSTSVSRSLCSLILGFYPNSIIQRFRLTSERRYRGMLKIVRCEIPGLGDSPRRPRIRGLRNGYFQCFWCLMHWEHIKVEPNVCSLNHPCRPLPLGPVYLC